MSVWRFGLLIVVALYAQTTSYHALTPCWSEHQALGHQYAYAGLSRLSSVAYSADHKWSNPNDRATPDPARVPTLVVATSSGFSRRGVVDSKRAARLGSS